MGPMGPAGFRRRGRRRGLVVGMAAGAAMANKGSKQAGSDGAQATTQPPANDMSSQLEELKTLKDQGIITQAEFDAKKKQILGI